MAAVPVAPAPRLTSPSKFAATAGAGAVLPDDNIRCVTRGWVTLTTIAELLTPTTPTIPGWRSSCSTNVADTKTAGVALHMQSAFRMALQNVMHRGNNANRSRFVIDFLDLFFDTDHGLCRSFRQIAALDRILLTKYCTRVRNVVSICCALTSVMLVCNA